MNQSKYSNYIDFDKLKLFLKNKFNEPLTWMIDILTHYISLLKQQIEDIDKLLSSQRKSEYVWNLQLKKQQLQNQLYLMETNKKKLEKMKL